MKNNHVRNAIFYIILIGIILASGFLLGQTDRVREILSSYSTSELDNKDNYRIKTNDLTVPVTTGRQVSRSEKIPDNSSKLFPGFQISSYYQYMQFYEGKKNVVTVYVKNTGDTPIFIYKFGFLLLSENETAMVDTGVTILPEEERNIGIITLDVPDDVEELKVRPEMAILAQTDLGKWHDYGIEDFREMTINVRESASMQEPEYSSNPEYVFNLVNSKIDPHNIQVRTMAAASAKKYPGKYNIYQVCALFDDTRGSIEYISDPRGRDLWSTPDETITVGAGDCDDYAILLASLIEAIGGTSRVYLTDTHAFATVYIGNDIEEVGRSIENYYGSVPIYYTTDQYGSWLMLDPTSSIYAGGLPSGTAPTDEGWTFLNTSTVTVIDIAPYI
jgi:transglutaminase-like putative cysteine protease